MGGLSGALGLALLSFSATIPGGNEVVLHPDSLSRTTVEIEGGRAKVAISFQSLSLIEVMEGLDANEDLELSDAEVEAAQREIESYLVGRLRFVLPGEGTEEAGGPVLAGRLESLGFLPEALVGPSFLQWMHAELEYRDDGRDLERFDLESLFFREENPLHSDVTTVRFAGEAPIDLYFSRLDVRHSIVAPRLRRPEVFRSFAATGMRHAFGLQALGLLCVLAVAVCGHARPRVVLASFFAAQVSAYLLGVLDLIDYPARLVWLAAALSVAYIGVENLVAPKRVGLLWEALGFGVVLGAAGALDWGWALEGEPLLETAGWGFAAGFFPLHGLALFLVAWLFARFGPEAFAVSPLAKGVSLVGVALGFVLFLQRAGWL